jgi:hypothetical protein
MNQLPLRRAIAASLLVAVFACATGTPYAQYAAAPPALAPGNGRILIYMTTQQGDFRVALSLDGATLGTIEPATFFYVDRPAGSHVVALPPPPHVDTFSQQAPTPPVTVNLAAGEIAYVEVSVAWTPGQITAVLAPADASAARADLEKLDLVPPGRL